MLPFNLERTGTNQYLVSNMVGEFIRLTENELNRLVDLRILPGDGLYEKAYAAHLVTGTNQNAQRQLLAARLRSRMGFRRQRGKTNSNRRLQFQNGNKRDAGFAN